MSADAANDRVLPGGLLGYLDGFEHHEVADGDLISLQGWILGNGSRVQSVVIKQKKGPPVPLSYGLSRPDVAVAYPEKPNAATSGFAGSVTIRRTASPRVLSEEIEIYAVLENGRKVSCFSRNLFFQESSAPAERQARTFLGSAAQKALAAYRDGRLSFSPAKWCRDLRYHYRASAAEQKQIAAREQFAYGMPGAGTDVRQETRMHAIKFQCFLDSNARLSLPRSDEPRVSIVFVVSNGDEWILQSLHALRDLMLPVEILIVDNASTEDMAHLLDRLDGVRILRRREKCEFQFAVNEAVRHAAGDHVLLLNDVEILPGSLESAIQRLESSDDIGAVGAKLVSPDGRLKESGGIVWRDGSYRGYGSGDDPRRGEYMYARDVDYCSAAFLLTPRRLFLSMGGIDEACRPASCHDIDYCVRLWKSNKRVVFDPGAVAIHFESAGAAPEAEVEKLPLERRRLFADQHAGWIASRPAPDDANPATLLEARSVSVPRKRVLVLDDRVPHYRHGAGFPRTVELLRTLVECGYFVTFYPMTMPFEAWSEVYEDIPRTVEVLTGLGTARLDRFLTERAGFYDRIIVSRPHNMQTFRAVMWKDGAWATRAEVIYDAEAIFSFREAEQRRMKGETVSEEEVSMLLKDEMSLTHGVHGVFSVTERERDCFLSSGAARAWVLSHKVDIQPTPRSFEDRSGLMFVGAMGGVPNRDAVLWFCREIWPSIRSQMPGVGFSAVGGNPPAEIQDLPGVDTPGQVADLSIYFDRSRIFVAPSRLAAGVPIKVQTAAAYGLPIVCTSILAEELGWRDGVELLVADDPVEFAKCCVRLYRDGDLWQRLRTQALERVARECSKESFAAALVNALD